MKRETGRVAWYLHHRSFCCEMLGSALYDKPGVPVLVVRALHLCGLCRALGLPC